MSIYEGNVLKGMVSGGQSLSGSAEKINVIKGESAYEIALLNGFKGTQAEWLESLEGEPGEDGKTPYIQDGYWYIDGVNLGVKAEGKPGPNGTSVSITMITESTESGGTNTVEFSDGKALKIRNGKDGGGGGGGATPEITVKEEGGEGVYFNAEDGNGVLTFYGTRGDEAVILRNIATPIGDRDAANKKYVDDAIGGLTIPAKMSELENDSGYLTSVPGEYVTETELAAKKYLTSYTETDPTVPAWAKEPTKPTYTPAEVGAEPSGKVTSSIGSHNTNTAAHNDIRLLIEGLATRLNSLANSDDTTLDQMAEVVAYIKANRDLIDQITTGKVNTADIVNNLTTNVATKPLSAAQGVALKALIDAITVPTKLSQLINDKGYLTSYTESDPTVPDWAKATTKPTYSKSEVGLGNVDNVKQYSASNPPPYPVTSVNGKTGAVTVSVPTKMSDLENDNDYAQLDDFSDWAKQTNKPSYTKSEVGLGNVDNVKQYSASNPPPYPVTSVNGKTGAVALTNETWTFTLADGSTVTKKVVLA